MLPTSITQFKKFGGFLMVKQIFLSIGMFLFLTFSVGCGNSSPETSVETFMNILGEVANEGEFTSSQRKALEKVVADSEKEKFFTQFEMIAEKYKNVSEALSVDVEVEYEILSDETKISEDGKKAKVHAKSVVVISNGKEIKSSDDFLLEKNSSGDWVILQDD